MDVILEKMKKELLRRRLSHRTTTTYLYWVRRFLRWAKKDAKELSKVHAQDYLDIFVRKELPGTTLNTIHAALRFLYVEVLRKSFRLRIKYARTRKRLPNYLSKEEVLCLIESIVNPRHRILIQLLYGAGLRASEAVKLRKEELDLKQGYGWVRSGKGRKDRPFVIPAALKEDLQYFPDGFLFRGRNGHLSVRSLQEIVRKAAKEVGLVDVHPHTLRHSFATHLAESGVDALTVQSLLGHGDMRTTMVYLHTAKRKIMKVESPLDSLFQNL